MLDVEEWHAGRFFGGGGGSVDIGISSMVG